MFTFPPNPHPGGFVTHFWFFNNSGFKNWDVVDRKKGHKYVNNIWGCGHALKSKYCRIHSTAHTLYKSPWTSCSPVLDVYCDVRCPIALSHNYLMPPVAGTGTAADHSPGTGDPWPRCSNRSETGDLQVEKRRDMLNYIKQLLLKLLTKGKQRHSLSLSISSQQVHRCTQSHKSALFQSGRQTCTDDRHPVIKSGLVCSIYSSFGLMSTHDTFSQMHSSSSWLWLACRPPRIIQSWLYDNHEAAAAEPTKDDTCTTGQRERDDK